MQHYSTISLVNNILLELTLVETEYISLIFDSVKADKYTLKSLALHEIPDLESDDIAAPLVYCKSAVYALDAFNSPFTYNLTVVPSYVPTT